MPKKSHAEMDDSTRSGGVARRHGCGIAAERRGRPLGDTTRHTADATSTDPKSGAGTIRSVTTATINRAMLQRVIAFANGKGGVFKTSLATTFAGLSALGGYRVLLIDLDPQGNAGEDLGYESDGGAALMRSLVLGETPLEPRLRQVRPGIDVIPGGEKLNDLAGLLVTRNLRGQNVSNLLASGLADLMERNLDEDGELPYDLVVIDCPPGEPSLQLLALCAARWLVIPTKADNASLKGMAQIATRLVEAREWNESIELLGVVLCDILPSAKKLRRETEVKINSMLGGVAPLFTHVIRNSVSAFAARGAGMLAHEYSASTGAEPFYKALQEGRSPSSAGSAPALAGDYTLLSEELLLRIASLEGDVVEAKGAIA